MNEPRFHPGDRVRLSGPGYDIWGYDEDTYHLADNSFQVQECRIDPRRGPLYVLDGFPYPLAEHELVFEEEYELEYGADVDEED